MRNMMSNTQEDEQEIDEQDILKSSNAVKSEKTNLENDSSETEEDDSRQNETEMKEALKKLMNLQKKKQKTNLLVSELGNISVIFSENISRSTLGSAN